MPFKQKIKMFVIFLIILFIITTINILLRPPQWVFTRVLAPIICPEAVYAVNVSEKIVALTIDDGPDLPQGESNSTAKILDLLKEYNQQATFFLIGEKVEKREGVEGRKLDSLIQRIIQEGHEIGNHLSRDEPSILLEDRFAAEFKQTQKQLSNYAQVSWFRPGVGCCDRSMINIISQQREYQPNQGLIRIALGSIWPYDTIISSAAFSRWFINHNIRPGAIIILHDGGARGDRTVQVLSNLLPDLKEKNYQLVTLSELLNQGQPATTSQELPNWLESIRLSVIKHLFAKNKL
jgi:peptidoglycan/xylan/chitin deacetylase (PgdA/CDA1 family)